VGAEKKCGLTYFGSLHASVAVVESDALVSFVDSVEKLKRPTGSALVELV